MSVAARPRTLRFGSVGCKRSSRTPSQGRACGGCAAQMPPQEIRGASWANNERGHSAHRFVVRIAEKLALSGAPYDAQLR